MSEVEHIKPTFAELKEEFVVCEKEYVIARKEYNEALEALQAACEHLTVVGGNEKYGDVDWRVCVTCGLSEYRGYEGGDEYNYGYRTPFIKLPVKSLRNPHGTIAYEPSGKELLTFRKYMV